MTTLALPRGLWNSFKVRLILTIGGLVAAFVGVVGGYFIHVSTQEMARFSGETLHAAAMAAAELLATEVHERSQEIDLLRRSPLFVEGDLQGSKVREALELRKSAHDQYLWIGVTDAAGQVMQATGGVLVGVDVRQRPWFQAAQAGPFVGDVHEAVLLAKHLPQQKSNEPLRFIDFASPIVDDQGRLRGVLGAHASWDWVSSSVVNKVVGSLERRHAQVLIANSKGDILFPFRYVGETRVPIPQAAVLPRFDVVDWGKEGAFLTSVVPVREVSASHLDWHVVLREPVDEAFSAVRALRLRLLTIALLALLVLLAVVYGIARATSGPIESLAQAARQVIRREANPVIPDARAAGSNEVADLCTGFQAMTASLLTREKELEALNASLEAQVAERTAALTLANQRLADLATTDGLTGVRNRRYFDEQVNEQFLLFKRTQHPFVVLLFDIDHFKNVNDRFGHPVGDDVLRMFAQVIQANTRGTDIVARYGGEEFVVLLRDARGLDDGREVADKVRAAVESAHFPTVGQITVSVGVTCVVDADVNATGVVGRADEALYQAKKNGRNRVEAL